MEGLSIVLEELKKLLASFTKNPNRKFTAQLILNKNSSLKELKRKFQGIIQQSSTLKKKDLEEISLRFNEIYLRIYNIIEKYTKELNTEAISEEGSNSEYEESTEKPENKDTITNMATANFDLLTAIKIVPQFNGEVKELENFLKIIDLYNGTLNEDGQNKLIDFIWCTRLTPKTKIRLAGKAQPNNLIQLKDNLQSTFKLTKTTQEIQGQLTNLKQNNLNVKDYVDKISLLIADLNKLQITEIGNDHRETICKLNDKFALTTFQNGLHATLKPTIFAAQCKTFAEAASLAEQIEKPINGEHRILQYNTYNNNRFRNNNNFNTYRNNQNNNNGNRNNIRRNNYNNNINQYNNNKYNNNNNNKNNYNNTNYNKYQGQRINRNKNFRRDQSNNFSPGKRQN